MRMPVTPSSASVVSIRILSTLALAASLSACGAERGNADSTAATASDSASAASSASHATTPDSAALDSAFAALQQRGADPRGMGVDQYTSIHKFDVLADGGRIELTRTAIDTAGVAQIRRHLQTIAKAFTAGNFSVPAFVHTGAVPGTDVMAAKRDAISYRYSDLPGGGEVRIVTADSTAVQAIHSFIKFQRGEHHSGGHGGH
jgi:hypothetical protein